MAKQWKVPRMWEGRTVAILASGESMSREVANAVVGRVPTIAINDTYKLAPEADMLYACDAKWWNTNPDALAFGGMKVTLDASLSARGVKLLHDSGTSGFDPNPANLRTGHNSGFQALHLAVHAGASRILLLGFDMRGKHWFGDHPAHLQDSDPNVFARFIAEFEKVAPIYAELGRTGGYCLDKARTLPPVNLTPDEAVAMAVALRGLEGTPFRAAAASALRKLVAAMQVDDAAAAHDLAREIAQRSPDSVAAAKRLFNSTWTSSPRATFARERAEQLLLLAVANTRAARTAAFKKVPAVFGPRVLP